MSSISSILFCAGRGTRLEPLTDVVPKAALPVLDVPLAAWGLKALSHLGRPTVVNVCHLGEQVVEALRPLRRFEILKEGPEPYGTAGTLRALRDRVGERVVTYNGDVLTDLSLGELLVTHLRSGCLGTIAVVRVPEMADLREDGTRVTDFVDRRKENVAGARFIGLAAWERAALDLLPDRRPAGLGETLLPRLVERSSLAVHVHEGYALDVGTPERYMRANLDVLAKVAPPLPAWPPGRIDGNSYLGPGSHAKDAEGSVLLAGSSAGKVLRSVVTSGEHVPPEVELVDALWGCGRIL